MNAGSVAKTGYILVGVVLAVGISLVIIFSRGNKLPAEQGFAFFTDQTGGDITFYQTQVKIRIIKNEFLLGFSSYGLGESGEPMVVGEKYVIRKRHSDVIEVADQEGRIHRVEFFRGPDRVVVGARIIGPGRVLEFHVAE